MSEEKNQTQVTSLKFNDEEKIVYGWAAVISEKGVPNVDHHGDRVKPEPFFRSINVFMEDSRKGLLMHQGERIGELIHSFPVNEEICKALGIDCEKEGWVVGMKIYDEVSWQLLKQGELLGFSIGGMVRRSPVNGE